MKQAIWHDLDMIKAALYGAALGLFVGIMIGYEIGWQPVVNTFRPLIG
jgi:ABC-type nitrate/sulfonate/bicarbonate transport system permease component